MLRVAVPNKGALSEPARAMLVEAGYLTSAGPRELMVHDPVNDVE
ncbi:MAG: ATP phosphoribosyltransferase, partial [Candidatus Nanopelagicales bacterium]